MRPALPLQHRLSLGLRRRGSVHGHARAALRFLSVLAGALSACAGTQPGEGLETGGTRQGSSGSGPSGSNTARGSDVEVDAGRADSSAHGATVDLDGGVPREGGREPIKHAVSPDGGGFTARCLPGASGSVQGLTPVGQHGHEWCWAASGEMLTRGKLPQCEQVSRKRGLSCCNASYCNGGENPAGCEMSDVPDLQPGFRVEQTSQALLPEAIKQQIACEDRPIAFGWNIGDPVPGNNAPGHMLVVVGYEQLDSGLWLRVVDPLVVPGRCHYEVQLITYEQYVSGYGHRHAVSLFGAKPIDAREP